VRIPNLLLTQRLGLFLYLTVGILLLIYALGFVSNVYLFYAYGGRGLVDFYKEMQIVNDALLLKAILAIVFALVLFFLELGKFPAGILTLVITLIIAAASIAFCADSLVVLADARQKYSQLDLSSLNRYIERGAIKYHYSTLTYDLGLGAYLLFLLSSLFMAAAVMRNALNRKGEGK